LFKFWAYFNIFFKGNFFYVEGKIFPLTYFDLAFSGEDPDRQAGNRN
jgi:hypothetical protein